MTKLILADSQDIFRTGTARVLAMDESCRIIAQCDDVARMTHAIATFPGAIVLFASSLHPDMLPLLTVLEAAGSRAIVIAENNESAEAYLSQGFRGVVFRSVTAAGLVECVRRVARGDTWVPTQLAIAEVASEDDMVGTSVRNRLTPKETRIVALIVQGFKNREIASRLKTTEQGIKNHLRSIYDKTGVSDRLELALFTIHHRALAQAAAEMGERLEAEEQQAMPTPVA
jgi:DNA-binding NarL/FixJ family response regulator